MRQSLPLSAKDHQEENKSLLWVRLPGLCCQAAGGEPAWADDIAVAWLLFYIAAHLMDNVEDRDAPDAWWAEKGPGLALNVATGLFFSAARTLDNLYQNEATKAVAADLVSDFHHSFLVMSSGQHLDLSLAQPTLEQYWQISEAKSGRFFALACRSGARPATSDSQILEGFSCFGKHLGALIQIHDDLEDTQTLQREGAQSFRPTFDRSLPVIFTLSVCPPSLASRLKECLREIPQHPKLAVEIMQIIENSGAVLYLLTEIERHRAEGVEALEKVAPVSSARQSLVDLLEMLVPDR